MYTHVIWDWNGTIISDLHVCFSVINGLLTSRGLPSLTPERYHEVFNFPVEAYYEQAGFDFSRDPYPVLAREFMEQYVPASLDCGMTPGALCALRYFRAVGAKQIILTASDTDTLAAQMDRLGVTGYFDAVLGQDNIYARGKAEIARDFIARSGLDPRKMLMIGDTLHDREIAGVLGCDCVLIARGHHSAERLRTGGCPVYSSLFAMLRAMEGETDACIFDLDGTVLNTLEDIAAAVNVTRRHFGLPEADTETVRRTVGHGARQLMEDMLPGHAEEALPVYREAYDAGLIVRTAPYRGVPEMLASLQKMGITVGLHSNKPDHQSRRLAEHFYKGVFGYVSGKREGVAPKPDPVGTLAAAAGLGADPARTAFVGDSEVDVASARNAGMRPLSVTWGFRSADDLLRAGARLLFDAPEELAAYLGDESGLPDPFKE